MKSCIFEGQVSHYRRRPVLHRFRYYLYLMYLDLDELPAVFDRHWLWSAKKPALARFRRRDHVGPHNLPLKDVIRELVGRETGSVPQGPVRLLTNLSYFGYCFNPVSFYYCFDEPGTGLEAVVAEVSNTPWGERHCYVLPTLPHKRTHRHSAMKAMHVSPFMDMEIRYDWCVSTPAKQLRVFMTNTDADGRVFDASLRLERKEITSGALARVLVSYPFMTLRTFVAIHWQALRLWLKRCPTYVHPDKRAASVTTR